MRDTALSQTLYWPLAALFGLWPLATFASGKAYVPLVVLLGLGLGWRILRARPANLVVSLGAFLLWACVSAMWLQTPMPLFTGSLLDGDFSVRAAQVRFVLSALGICLFMAAILKQAAPRLTSLAPVMGIAILAQLAILIWLAIQRDSLIAANSAGTFVPSPQSLGRNANLLALALPVLMGIVLNRWRGPAAIFACLAIGIIGLAIFTTHDAQAALLGCVLAAICAGLVFAFRQRGFRLIFNLVAIAVIAAPGLARLVTHMFRPDDLSLPLSAEQRLVIWQAALEKIAQKPILGHGVNSVRLSTETYATRPDLLAQLDPILIDARLFPAHTHNMPLQVWVETGLIGAGLLAIVFVGLGRALPRPDALNSGARIAIAGVMGVALAMFAVAYSVWDESFWSSLAVVACALIVLARQEKRAAS